MTDVRVTQCKEHKSHAQLWCKSISLVTLRGCRSGSPWAIPHYREDAEVVVQRLVVAAALIMTLDVIAPCVVVKLKKFLPIVPLASA